MPKLTETINSVSGDSLRKACNIPIQDFGLAGKIRDVQRTLDPDGNRKLTAKQARAVRDFFEVVIATRPK